MSAAQETAAEAHAPCEFCRLEAAGGPPGGWVHQDELWSAGVLGEHEVPGWIVGQLRRHAVGITALTSAEFASLGPLLERLSRAIVDVTDAERVYLIAISESAPHWHFLLAPRGPGVAPGHRSLQLIARRLELIDHDAAAAVAEALRQRLGAGHDAA